MSSSNVSHDFKAPPSGGIALLQACIATIVILLAGSLETAADDLIRWQPNGDPPSHTVDDFDRAPDSPDFRADIRIERPPPPNLPNVTNRCSHADYYVYTGRNPDDPRTLSTVLRPGGQSCDSQKADAFIGYPAGEIWQECRRRANIRPDGEGGTLNFNYTFNVRVDGHFCYIHETRQATGQGTSINQRCEWAIASGTRQITAPVVCHVPQNRTPRPVLSPASGSEIFLEQNAALNLSVPGFDNQDVDILYTTDGSDPRFSQTARYARRYGSSGSNPRGNYIDFVPGQNTFRFTAKAQGLRHSDVDTAEYQVGRRVTGVDLSMGGTAPEASRTALTVELSGPSEYVVEPETADWRPLRLEARVTGRPRNAAVMIAWDLDNDGQHDASTIGSRDTFSFVIPASRLDLASGSFTTRAWVTDGETDLIESNPVTIRLLQPEETQDAPTASRPTRDQFETAEDTLLEIAPASILANDIQGDAERLRISFVSEGHNGRARLRQHDGVIVFTPDPNFSGQASFTYRLEGQREADPPGVVLITVTPINDPPFILTGPKVQATPGETVQFTGPNAITIGDTDIGAHALSIVIRVSQGGLTLGNASGVNVISRSENTPLISITGSLSAVNAALSSLTWRWDQPGQAIMTVRASDNGHAGAGRPETRQKTINIDSSNPGNDPPAADFNARVVAGVIHWDASGSRDSDGPYPLYFEWDLDDDGIFDAADRDTRALIGAAYTGIGVQVAQSSGATMPASGTRSFRLRVTDADGASSVVRKTFSLDQDQADFSVRIRGPSEFTVDTRNPQANRITLIASILGRPQDQTPRIQWDFGDDGTFIGTAGLIATATSQDIRPERGRFVARVVVTDRINQRSATARISIPLIVPQEAPLPDDDTPQSETQEPQPGPGPTPAITLRPDTAPDTQHVAVALGNQDAGAQTYRFRVPVVISDLREGVFDSAKLLCEMHSRLGALLGQYESDPIAINDGAARQTFEFSMTEPGEDAGSRASNWKCRLLVRTVGGNFAVAQSGFNLLRVNGRQNLFTTSPDTTSVDGQVGRNGTISRPWSGTE